MPADADIKHMRRALALATRGRGLVEPNPMVGCVLVRDGKILASGFHKRFGGSHAEVVALADAAKKGVDVSACEMFVTLEPCCHHGKTPPCTDAILAARPRRVVVAMVDPFEKVAGKGIALLRTAGVRVDVGVCESEARELNAPFIKRMTTGLPWVIAKWAQSVDGRIAARDGSSKWISGNASREFVHRLRGRVDAIVVGIGTVLADDPSLTARPASKRDVKRAARRVVIDPRLHIPDSAKLLAGGPMPPVTIGVDDAELSRPAIAEQAAALRSRGVEIVALPAIASPGSHALGQSRRLALAPLLRHLASVHGATNVLVEGGGGVIGAMLEESLIDELNVFIAPTLIGDTQAVPALRGVSCDTIAQARRFALRAVERFGDDVMLRYTAPRTGA